MPVSITGASLAHFRRNWRYPRYRSMLNGEEPMPAVFRPRRSLLYMPGSNPRALEKGRDLPADGLIIDLEDAVAPEAKVQARAAVVKALQQGFGEREILGGINGLDTRW